ncbi:MAG: hypothetical protein EA361_16115 [Bacteroidetes bacterium]|nr:MAG: hypothetical protein EA361_16115 [Bacteroidota bacterium]
MACWYHKQKSSSPCKPGRGLSMSIPIAFLLCCLALPHQSLFAQIVNGDTIAHNDSIPYWIKLLQRTTLNLDAQWFFRQINPEPREQYEDLLKKQLQASREGKIVQTRHYNHKSLEGLRIREVNIINVPPLGESKNETSSFQAIQQTGNKIHSDSKEAQVRKVLLFQEGDSLNLYQAYQSERLLRGHKAIRDAHIFIERDPLAPEEVIVWVHVQDYWAWIPGFNFKLSQPNLTLHNNNIAGYLHQAALGYTLGPDSLQGFNNSVSLHNLLGRHATLTYQYSTPRVGSYQKISLIRDFFHPQAAWSLGTNHQWTNKHWEHVSIFKEGTQKIPISYRAHEAWISHSLAVNQINPHLRPHQRLVASMGFFKKEFTDNTHFFHDSLRLFHQQELLLLSLGYSSRKYYTDRFIYDFGKTEDISQGFLLALTGGRDFGSNPFHSYGAVNFGFSRHLGTLGYISSGVQYGGYIKKGTLSDGVFKTSLTWFSNLYSFRGTYHRTFIHGGYTNGINRKTAKRISLSSPNGIYGFNDRERYGKTKLYLNLENVTYIPKSFHGFNLGVMSYFGAGFLAENHNDLLHSGFQSVVGFGLLINNQYLDISTIRISFGYYPASNGNGQSSFRFNPPGTYNLRPADLHFDRPLIPEYN